jgi:hypothetical protein
MIEIPLDGKVWEFRLPMRAICQDLLVANSTNKARAQAAAVGLCLIEQGTARQEVRFCPDLSYLAVGCNALVYGGGVIEQAYKRRVPDALLAKAGQLCLGAVSDAFELIPVPPTAEELKAAEDFTDPKEASGP